MNTNTKIHSAKYPKNKKKLLSISKDLCHYVNESNNPYDGFEVISKLLEEICVLESSMLVNSFTINMINKMTKQFCQMKTINTLEVLSNVSKWILSFQRKNSVSGWNKYLSSVLKLLLTTSF